MTPAVRTMPSDRSCTCQAESYLVGLDPDVTAFTFWAAVHGAISLALRQPIPFDEVDA